jgi:ribosomal protein S18 acetylase RimI-like enzyme
MLALAASPCEGRRRYQGALVIRELHASDVVTAAGVLSRGMRDNPNNVAAFGTSAARRERVLAAFFRALLGGQLHRGVILGAFDGSALQGVCGMARPGACQPAAAEKIRILSGLAAEGAVGAALRVGRWAAEWGRHDPEGVHWHLGPVAVDAHLRSRGIGGAMLAAFCERMDAAGAVAYLETDKHENVGFYERYRFRADAKSSVLGMPNWYMTRRPEGSG